MSSNGSGIYGFSLASVFFNGSIQYDFFNYNIFGSFSKLFAFCGEGRFL